MGTDFVQPPIQTMQDFVTPIQTTQDFMTPIQTTQDFDSLLPL